MQDKKIYLRILVNFIVTIVIAVLLLLIIPWGVRFFFPFVIAFFISMLANPVVRFMEKRVKIVRKHGSAIIIVLTILLICGLLYLIGSILVREIVSLIKDIPNITVSITNLIEKLSVRLEKIYDILPVGVQKFFDGFPKTTEANLTNFLSGIELPTIWEAGGYVKNIANIFFMAIITILSSYFFIAERDKFAEKARKIFPESILNTYRLVSDNFKSAVGGYFKAQFKIMLLLLVIMFIAFEFMGVHYSFLIAFGIALLDFLPVFGTGAVLWPWIIVDLISGSYLRAAVLAGLYLVCQLIKQLLQPKMVGDSIGISPLMALIFMFTGYRIQGVLGMILGIPIGMVFTSFYRLGMFNRIIKGFSILAKDINQFRKY